ncbi:MAG: hypothetical protein QXD43_02190 [Candidatus Aenigmatarchaeota archaeon]
MSKAIVLPVNILVIVAIATIATIGLVGVYGVGYNPFSAAMGLESVKNLACRQLVMRGCKDDTSRILVNYDVNGDGVNDTQDNLLALCSKFFGRSDDASCRQMCGCVGTLNQTTTSGGGGITLNPSSGSTTPGGTLTSTVTVTRFNSTVSEDVVLSITSCQGATCSLSVLSCFVNPSCTSTLTINAGSTTGTYTITVSGRGSITGITRTASYRLTISTSVPCQCSDGTPCNSCSSNKPKYCTSSRTLIDRCSQCGCPTGQQCNADGTCSAVSNCTCNWNLTYECGNGCKVNNIWDGWKKRCECNIHNCGLCMPEGVPDGSIICTDSVC